jgi:hypothetical protein
MKFWKVIMISVFDTWSIVQSFKTIKFKRNFTKVIRISVFGTLSIVESFKI